MSTRSRTLSRELALYAIDWACHRAPMPDEAAAVDTWLGDHHAPGTVPAALRNFAYMRDTAFKARVDARMRRIIRAKKQSWTMSIVCSRLAFRIALEMGPCTEREFFKRFAPAARAANIVQRHAIDSARATRLSPDAILGNIDEYTASIDDHRRYLRECRALRREHPSPELRGRIRATRQALAAMRAARRKLALRLRGTVHEDAASRWF